ncbi:TspO/MBR family protein [Nocardia sp. CS682]|uniref:TspO/MBR family protein n=1 Tax=Nocardia sp. CS682 TaxID=1047172 RepID=UPI001F0D2C29|nr:TspO/MBR family protein [Nocardia sp. CS682]
MLLLVVAAAATGNLAAQSSAEQYNQLDQPGWAPPSWVFGPVWTLLYALMALSAWWIWRGEPWQRVRWALAMFVGQLVLNALWTPLFFGADLRGLALAEILVLLVAIIATMAIFRRHSRFAAALLVPYLMWTTFAAALNFSVWQLNN